MKCVEKFNQIYKKDPTDVSFCPYRISPLGTHVDHQLGRITGLAIDKGIPIAYGPKKNDWADYLRGVTWPLGQKYQLHTGFCDVIKGNLLIDGLFSSAAFFICSMKILC